MGSLTDRGEPTVPKVGTLVVVAPRSSDSGVGDHADRLIDALRPHAQRVVEVRCGGAGQNSVADCLRLRRQVSRVLARHDPAGTVVHAEFSGGSVGPFWATAFRHGVVSTALVHDPPRPVWAILRFRLLARSRLLDNAVQWAIDPLLETVERAGLRGVGLVATSTEGARGLAQHRFGRAVRTGRLLPPQLLPDPPPPATSRPPAVGLFGYHYRGKGFELLDELRARLDPRVEIVVAGYGTQTLPARTGIRVLGALDERGKQRFFAGIRLLLLPYRRKTVWGVRAHPSSGTFMDAAAHRTPCLALASADLEALRGSGCESVPDLVAMAGRSSALVLHDTAGLERLAAEIDAFRQRQSTARTVAPIVSQWRAG